MSGLFDQFPLFAEALRQWEQETLDRLRSELGAGEWVDQERSVLGRNKHIAACKRLIRHDSADAYFDSTQGRWFMRSRALDAEIVRRNHEFAQRLPPSEPPPPLAKTTPGADVEDDAGTGIYERQLLERFGVGR